MPVWTQSAHADLSAILARIAEDDPLTAARIAADIKRATTRLDTYPAMGRPGRAPQTRELVLPNLPFVIVYRENDIRAEILRVLHTRMRWPEGEDR